MTSSPTTIQTILRSEGVVLAAIPFVGSLIALGFEVGYLSYFDVPAEYVEVGFNSIVAATAALAIPVALLWIYLAQIIRFFEATHPIWHVIGQAMIYTLIPLVVVLIGHRSSKELFIPLGIFVFFIVAYLTPPLFKRDSSTPYWGRVKSEIKMDNKTVAEGKKRKSGEFLDLLLVPLTAVFFTVAFCGYLGYSFARGEKARWVLEDDPRYLVVRKYGELFVLKQFDPTTRTLVDSIQIKKLDDGKSIRLKKLEIGELVKPQGKKGG